LLDSLLQEINLSLTVTRVVTEIRLGVLLGELRDLQEFRIKKLQSFKI